VADDAVERRLRRHRDHRIDQPAVDLFAAFDPRINFGQHIARARRGFGLPFDLHAVAARRNINAEPVLDRHQITVKLAEQYAQKLGSLELHRQSDAVAGFGGRCGGQRAFRHVGRAPSFSNNLCTPAKAGVHLP
jgi:hypothetical protein